MAQLSDDCFAFGGELMSTERALEILDSRLSPVTGTERVALSAAPGRVLAEDVTAPRDVPPHDNAAVDGFAVYFDDLAPERETRLPVAGHIAAGHPLERAPRRGEAYRIFTGAPVPRDDGDGPDTVFMQEDCRVQGDEVIVPAGIKRGANRRPRGEDIRAGDVVLRGGRRLRPQDIGLAASVGRTDLELYQPLRVAVFSTGDEVIEPGQPLPEGCIYDSNRYGLIALLEGMGCRVTDLGILPDCLDDIHAAMAGASREHDLLVTSGGVSTGEQDHVRAAVEALGSIHFWRLAIKPGRPIAFGRIRREAGDAAFIGLPGNPVAVMVTFLRFARPAILRLSGCKDITPLTFRVPTDFDYKKKQNRREWIRARLVPDGAGRLVARKYPKAGSGILTSMVEADGLIEVGEGISEFKSGDLVDFLPFSEVMA